MRQTIKNIEVNTAYRWFLGLSLDDAKLIIGDLLPFTMILGRKPPKYNDSLIRKILLKDYRFMQVFIRKRSELRLKNSHVS